MGPPVRGPMMPPPQRPRRSSVLPIVIAIVLVVLAIGGGGTAVALNYDKLFGPKGQPTTAPTPGSSEPSSEPSGSPSPTADASGKITWQIDQKTRGKAKNTLAFWVTDGLAVHASDYDVIAYDAETGKQAWRFAAPLIDKGTGTQKVCGAGSTVQDGKVAVTYGAGLKQGTVTSFTCTGIALLDIKTGKAVWTADLRTGGPAPQLFSPTAQVEITGTNVTVRTTTQLVGYGLADGKRKWIGQTLVPGRPDRVCVWNDILPSPDGGYGLAQCGLSETLSVVEIIPDNGIPGRTDIPKEVAGVSPCCGTIVSSSPLVVAVRANQSKIAGRYLVYDDQNRMRAKIIRGKAASDDLNHLWQSFDNGGHQFRRVAVSDQVLVAPTMTERDGSAKLIGFDLVDGRQVWEATLGKGVAPVIVGMDAQSVIAIGRKVSDEDPMPLVRVSLANGKVTPIANGFAGSGLNYGVDESRLIWADGAVYGAAWSIASHRPALFRLD